MLTIVYVFVNNAIHKFRPLMSATVQEKTAVAFANGRFSPPTPKTGKGNVYVVESVALGASAVARFFCIWAT